MGSTMAGEADDDDDDMIGTETETTFSDQLLGEVWGRTQKDATRMATTSETARKCTSFYSTRNVENEILHANYGMDDKLRELKCFGG